MFNNFRFTFKSCCNRQEGDFMPLRELLLNSSSFTEVLKQYSISPADFTVKDESLIMSEKNIAKKDVFKDVVLIEGHNDKGQVNLIGTLYCNFLKDIAVFELESAEQVKSGVAQV